jgi:aryl-alcohol dehydrogenase-like predicted oxidoreductase
MNRREALALGMYAGAAAVGSRGVRAASASSHELALVTKAIPSSGERLPVIGVGTNAFSPRSPDELASLRDVLKRLPELGGAVVDTAPIYGQSESVIGDLVGSLGVRKQLFLATKVMARDAEAGKASMDESLQKLKTERVDLLQVHNLVGVDAMLPLLQEWKKAGRIRYFGITTSNPADHPRMIEAMRRYTLDFIQVDYSIGNRGAADQVLPLAQERGTAVLVNVPFGGRRGAASVFAQVAGRKLPDWAADIDVESWGQFFLKYVVSHPAVTCTIPGTTQLAHLEDNQRGGRGRLPDAAMRKRMEQVWDTKA